MGITSQVLSAVRRTKSDAKVSMRAQVERVTVAAEASELDRLREAEDDLLAAARGASIEYSEGEFSVQADLVDPSNS